MKRWILFSTLVVILAPVVLAEEPAMTGCKAMMQQQEQMKKHMDEMNSKLQTLVDDMNGAQGAARVDKLAAVVNEMVAQRTMMQKEMMEMQPMMAGHMMEHMQAMKGMQGKMGKGTQPMAGCPMMQDDKAAKETTPAHKH